MDSYPPSRPLYARPWILAPVATVFALVLATVVLMAVRPYLSPTLADWTGEEDYREQLKGTVALLWLRVTRHQPEQQSYVPIVHAGVNPFGINTFLEQEVEPEKVDRSLRMIRDAGFHWVRQEFPWEDIEIREKGDFWDHKWDVSAWEKYDRIVELASKYELEIIARLDNPPAWSRKEGNAVGALAPPDDLNDFGDFVYTFVRRYRGRIRYYQIWNEPNIYPEWGERPVSAAEYVELLKTAHERAKAADPNCVILSAGLAQTTERGPTNLSDLVYLEQMYDAGASGCFDILGANLYGLWTGPSDYRTSPDRTNFSRPILLREIMVRNGDAHKPIWATEVGWNALPPDFPGFPNFGRVTEEQQARYAAQAYIRAQREWPWMGVMNYWFFKRATDLEMDQTFYYFRIVEPDFTPLPVLGAMSELTRRQFPLSIGYHQEDHWALQWGGSWRTVDDERAVLGAYRVGERADASLEFTFSGTDLDLLACGGSNAGSFSLRIDNEDPSTVWLAGTESQVQTLVALARGLPRGDHSVRIVVEEGPVKVDGLIVRRVRSWRHWWTMGIVIVALFSLASWSIRRLRARGDHPCTQ